MLKTIKAVLEANSIFKEINADSYKSTRRLATLNMTSVNLLIQQTNTSKVVQTSIISLTYVCQKNYPLFTFVVNLGNAYYLQYKLLKNKSYLKGIALVSVLNVANYCLDSLIKKQKSTSAH